jgi:hypothetical protein
MALYHFLNREVYNKSVDDLERELLDYLENTEVFFSFPALGYGLVSTI